MQQMICPLAQNALFCKQVVKTILFNECILRALRCDINYGESLVEVQLSQSEYLYY